MCVYTGCVFYVENIHPQKQKDRRSSILLYKGGAGEIVLGIHIRTMVS